MKFFKKLKSSILGSVKEDLNSALGGKQLLFNSKISGALDDLISMKTGIQISNVPRSITERAAGEAEARRMEARLPINAYDDSGCFKEAPYIPPSNRGMLRFPVDDTRYIDNWIVFRTVDRTIDAQHIVGSSGGIGSGNQAHSMEEMDATGLSTEGLQQGRNGKRTYKLNQSEDGKGAVMNEGYTIALYLPNNVKDTISVEYEATDIGIGDTILNAMFGKGGEYKMASWDAMIDGFGEAWKGMANKMIAIRALQEGVAANNPKFSTFTGVGMREHTYTFNLNPYNKNDAEEITEIIKAFKMLSLPTNSMHNPRLKILPAEFEINFFGPILGHIEHPQNCFLSQVDVDYSGGKDMSFIADESFSAAKDAVEANEKKGIEAQDAVAASANIQHYPNGITLTLQFKEILQLTRQRYLARVAADQRGKSQENTIKDIFDRDMGLADDNYPKEETTTESTEEGPNPAVESLVTEIDVVGGGGHASVFLNFNTGKSFTGDAAGLAQARNALKDLGDGYAIALYETKEGYHARGVIPAVRKYVIIKAGTDKRVMRAIKATYL